MYQGIFQTYIALHHRKLPPFAKIMQNFIQNGFFQNHNFLMSSEFRGVLRWCGISEIIISSLKSFFSLQLHEFLQSEVKQKLSSNQKINNITANADKDILLSRPFETFFQKTIDFVESLEIMHIIGGWGSCCLCHYDALRTKIDM